EQIDALEVLGLRPMSNLVGPRVLACMLTLPLLTITISALALGGSYGAELLGGSMAWRQYWNESLRGLRVQDIIPATLKTVLFGYLIGATACFFGMHAQGGTEGVGQAATRSVVASIFLVVMADVLSVMVIHLLDW
ncbi:MAG: ABC transporter permease, partial [Planctomycetes bacterium]|nr:ABC transporter permease [Planctomycetota bacterium]